MPSGKQILLASTSLVLAAVTMQVIFSSSTYLQPMVHSCVSQPLNDKTTGHGWAHLLQPVSSYHIPIIDHFLCFITPFFDAVVQSGNVGTASYAFVCAPLLAAFLFFGIESSRQGAPFLVRWGVLVFALGQLISISVAVPLLLLPAWFLGKNRLRGFTAKNRPGYLSGSDAVMANAIAIWWLSVVIPLLAAAAHLWYLWINLFQFAPLAGFIPSIFVFFYGYDNDVLEAKVASDTALKLYKLYAFILAVVHVGYSYLLINEPGFSPRFLVDIDPTSPLSTCVFLFIDGLSLSLSLGLLVLAEDGFLNFCYFAAMSIFIGPGAAFLVTCSKREQACMNGLIKLAKLDKSKDAKSH
ncbi:hypothetical protein HDU91_000625 [Kappamyces sp. JEL0680]|nr:hypothetical protein HDU91_000625 [Kappamyces sp. JEL0680]